MATPRSVWITLAILLGLLVAIGAIHSRDTTRPPSSAASASTTLPATVATANTSTTTPATTSSATDPVTTGVRPANRPDASLTPGAIFPSVTAAQVCVSGYSSSVRDVPQSEKDRVYAEYAITSHAPGEYEIDHLISLELGGSNDISNLWPEPYTGTDNAHDKDTIENRLHSMVCSGAITLAVAQADIVHWWDFE